jgi:type III restriction enzyme
MAKASHTTSASLDFAFFNFLWQFYSANRGVIRRQYKELTRKFLDFNDPDRSPKAYLRQPQFEALEIYIFLKEFLDNAKVEDIFHDWFEKKGRFLGRSEGGRVGHEGAGQLFDFVTKDQYRAVFSSMQKNARAYPNYIFALTMGTGKTLLMATCIFYEFLLGNKFEKNTRYCHNALIFAPDRTVLQTIIRDIEGFDLSKVVPPEYVNFLSSHLRLHFLEEAGTALSLLDRSRFNIIISNTQKIILKKQHKEKTALDRLFNPAADAVPASEIPSEGGEISEESELTTNQRFEKLCRLEQLGIYVDEAHHVFGVSLAKDMGIGAHANDTRASSDLIESDLGFPK